MLTWVAVEKNKSTMGDLLRIREEARKLLVETVVRKGERQTQDELFHLHRLLRPGDIVVYDGPDALKMLVRIGDNVMGNKIKKLENINKILTPPVDNRIGYGGSEDTKICFSAYRPIVDSVIQSLNFSNGFSKIWKANHHRGHQRE